ncbi:MAG: OmpA family protein [Bryobacteraceae bacterium]
MNQLKLSGAFLLACGVLAAQDSAMPIYRVSVTSRTIKAVSYQHRSGATKIDFRGTDLLPAARGVASVNSKQGRIDIDADFEGLQSATKYGAEYLTYVLWAVTPEGRTANLGEVLLNGSKSKLNVSTDLQVFGLLVTAEPYFAVTKPSDLIVMENVVRVDTVGKVEEMDAKYELLQRGQYARMANPLSLKPDKKLPLELYEGRNAVQIARAMGADHFANETFQKAEKSLSQAEAYQSRKAGMKPVAMTAREAVQMAEDSRAIAVKRQEDEALNAERQGSMAREASAEKGQAAAQSETDRVTREAEAARVQAQAQMTASSAEAERLKRENETNAAAASAEAARVKLENEMRATTAKNDSDSRLAAAGAEAERLKGENEANAAAASTEAARVKLENEMRATTAKNDSDSRLAAAGAEADRLKRDNDAQKLASQAELDRVAGQKAQLEADKSELRVQLLAQFNAILQTTDTARGLIVNMSDVLFDTGKYTLRPLAREKLAKVAGIVSGHPGLKLDVEGYTDSVGGDDYNQQLSEKRAGSVSGYLTQQGMPLTSVTAKGFGKAQPVASNDNAQGRQQNRRVELVISGEIIGTAIGTPLAIR